MHYQYMVKHAGPKKYERQLLCTPLGPHFILEAICCFSATMLDLYQNATDHKVPTMPSTKLWPCFCLLQNKTLQTEH